MDHIKTYEAFDASQITPGEFPLDVIEEIKDINLDLTDNGFYCQYNFDHRITQTDGDGNPYFIDGRILVSRTDQRNFKFSDIEGVYSRLKTYLNMVGYNSKCNANALWKARKEDPLYMALSIYIIKL